MVTLGGKDKGLEPENRISTSMSSVLDLWINRNIFLPWVVYMCDMVTISGKDNGLEPGNRISTLMFSVPDLWPFDLKISREHFPSMGNQMCDMVTVGGKGDVLEAGNHCVYRRMDGQPDSSIPPATSLQGV
jgi:hypothetical protein